MVPEGLYLRMGLNRSLIASESERETLPWQSLCLSIRIYKFPFSSACLSRDLASSSLSELFSNDTTRDAKSLALRLDSEHVINVIWFLKCPSAGSAEKDAAGTCRNLSSEAKIRSPLS